MNLLQTLLAFIVALGPLIIFHELGHYWVARWCGVKVLRFSVGIGRVVWSRRFGPDQTEWAISALPLGGYVQMLDARDPAQLPLAPHEAGREFTQQSVWRRMAIIAAGPLANFVLAGVVFAGLYMHGIAEPSSKVRVAGSSTPAYLAGVRSGDTVAAVNGEATPNWSELRLRVMQAAVSKSALALDIDGAGGGRRQAVVPAAGLSSLALDGDLMAGLGLGVALPKPVLGDVLAGGAAARAGLRSGDRIVAVDGKELADGLDFITLMKASAGKALHFDVLRDGRNVALVVTPDAENQPAAAGQPAVTIGKIKAAVMMAPDMITVPLLPLAAIGKGISTVGDMAVLQVRMLGKMVVGQLSLKNISGPITIADYAGQSARAGLIVYLSFIASVSITLGVMNLLPIPVLDGGHLLYYSLEVLTGRPVPERVNAIVQRLGVGLLAALMALAVFNDVGRLLPSP